MSSNKTEDNPYLAFRAAKIARNNAKLEELGLATKPVVEPVVADRQTPARRGLPRPIQQPTRRSTRITGQQAPVVQELPDEFEASVPSLRGKRQRPRRPGPKNANEANVAKKARAAKTTKNAYVPPANSVRRIHLRVNDTVDKFLGRTMEKTGKAFVMHTSLGGLHVSFNKYSGVQEWMNDAIYLWVNVGKKDDDVVNDFLDNGRQISWFGGSRMHDETPTIQRLIRIGKDTKKDPDKGIVLWCRHYNTAAKTYHPYTCLGRLSYESHVVGSRPLKFIWRLLDYDRLLQHEDENVQKRFQEIMDL
mmetsp:Transcript_14221/g.23554  ORF Transcript_14221/g.23554 Transcript_14221/m.23554 type:complete len:305 (-) Transcript_14221:144-1058(-)